MSRLLIILLPILLLTTSCWKGKVKNLSDVEFDHYYALRVYMDEPAQKTYLKLKTEEERNAYLKKAGLWDRFYAYDDHIREKIVGGEVQPGWDKKMLMMAWGRPYSTGRLPGRDAERSWLYTYRFEEQQDGSILVWEQGSKTEYKAARLFEREVVLDDDVIAEIREKKAAW